MLTPEKANELRESMRKTYADVVKLLFKVGGGDEKWVRSVTEQWFAQAKEASVREPNRGFERDPALRQQFSPAQTTGGPGAMTIDELYALVSDPNPLEQQTARVVDKAYRRLLVGVFLHVQCDEKALRQVVDDWIKEALTEYVGDLLLKGITKQTENMEAEIRLKEEGLQKAKKALGRA